MIREFLLYVSIEFIFPIVWFWFAKRTIKEIPSIPRLEKFKKIAMFLNGFLGFLIIVNTAIFAYVMLTSDLQHMILPYGVLTCNILGALCIIFTAAIVIPTKAINAIFDNKEDE